MFTTTQSEAAASVPAGLADAVGDAEGVAEAEAVGVTVGLAVAVGLAVTEGVGVTDGVETEEIVGDGLGAALNVAFCAKLEVAGNNTLTQMVVTRSVCRKVVHSGLSTCKA